MPGGRPKTRRKDRLAEAILDVRTRAVAGGWPTPPETNHADAIVSYCSLEVLSRRETEDLRTLHRLLREVRRSPTSLKGAWAIVTVREVMTL